MTLRMSRRQQVSRPKSQTGRLRALVNELRHFRSRGYRTLVISCRVFGLCLISAVLFSCEGNDRNNGVGGSSTSASNLSELEAIDAVKAYLLAQSRPAASVQPTCRWRTRQDRRACSQIDVDTDPNKKDAFLARCKPKGGTGSARYGYKTVPVRYQDCRDRKVTRQGPCPRPAQGGDWAAQYSAASHEWQVEVRGSSRGTNSWSVDDASAKVTSDQPPC